MNNAGVQKPWKSTCNRELRVSSWCRTVMETGIEQHGASQDSELQQMFYSITVFSKLFLT